MIRPDDPILPITGSQVFGNDGGGAAAMGVLLYAITLVGSLNPAPVLGGWWGRTVSASAERETVAWVRVGEGRSIPGQSARCAADLASRQLEFCASENVVGFVYTR
jgi:hypothetical protein